MNRQQHLQMANIIAQQTSLAQQLSHEQFIAQFKLQAQNSRQYLLSLQTKQQTFGSLSDIPTTLSQCPNLTRFPIWLAQYDEIRLVSGCSHTLASGTLVIAIDDESLYELKAQFISASAIALLLALLLGLITGLVFSMRVLKRINGFNQVAQRVESGEMSARVAVSTHHDEYDHMALHINTMLNQLQYSFETIAGITDAIAHDLRTPLSHLRQQIESEILNKQRQNQPTEPLESMLNKLDEVLFTFSAMLELTRLQQQREDNSQNFTQVHLQQVIVDAVDLIEPLAEAQQQSVTIDNKQDLSIQGDATLLFRAVYNLLENASKYAGENAQINVRLTDIGFIISDNGPGISDSEKEKVFQRLYRIEKSRGISGFGLGLTLVKAVVQLHHGSIELVDNHPGLAVKVQFTH